MRDLIGFIVLIIFVWAAMKGPVEVATILNQAWHVLIQ
jgi:hypothetical protein